MHGSDFMKWFSIMIGAHLALVLTSAGTSADLSSYPIANQIWIGAFGGEVEVNPESDLMSSRFGEIHWLAQDGALVAEDDVIAYCGYAKIRLSEAQLELAQKDLDLKLKASRWAHAEKALSLERELADLEGQYERLELAPAERKLVGAKLAERIEQRREKLRGQMAGIRAKLEPSHREAELFVEQNQLQQEIERKRQEHKELLHSQAVIAPHEGVVHQLRSGEVRSGVLMGKLELRGRAIAKLRLLDPEVLSLPPESLAISIMDEKGGQINGRFKKIDRPIALDMGPKVYHFELSGTDESRLVKELTGERIVTVFRILDRPARIVGKSKFLFANPEKIQSMGWRPFIKSIWPKAEILYIGPSAIAITEDP